MDDKISMTETEENRLSPLPTPIPIELPLDDEEVHIISVDEDELFPQAGDSWEKCYSTVKKYDDALCSGWREEVDKLLIFAGLFSATVTAFLLDTYKKLSEDPADKTNWLLEQLLLQNHNTNIGNISSSSKLPIPPTFAPAAIDVRLNTLWFLSLSLSLSTVVLGILCIQWLREYQRAAPLDPKDAISLRQIRYDGFVAWKVPTVLVSLPVLLHLSLILFFAGLLDLLWNLNHTVAAFVTAVAGIALIVISITTVLPGLQLLFMPKGAVFMPQCPYKSPQAWTFHRLLTWIVGALPGRRRVFEKSFRLNRYSRFFLTNTDWVDFDVSWRKFRKTTRKALIRKEPPDDNEITDVGKGLVWIEMHLGHTSDVITAIYRCIKAITSRDGFHVVSQMNGKDRNQRPQDMLKNSGGLAETRCQELASLLFLEQQTRTFPQLEDRYFQLLVRFLGAQIREAGLPDNPSSTSGDHLYFALPFERLRTFSMHDRPAGVVLEYLQCLRKLASNGLLNSDAFQEDVRDLIHDILLPRSVSKGEREVNSELIAQISCEIFVAQVNNLLRHSPPHQYPPQTSINSNGQLSSEAKLVKRCAAAALRAFKIKHDFGDLRPSIFPVLTSIDERMRAQHGGRAKLLAPRNAADWEKLMEDMRPIGNP